MATEISRLVMGLLVLFFHKQIADYIFALEVQLAELLNSRGVKIPVPTQATFHNVYFFLGLGIAALSMVKMWSGNLS